jgi:hypothetical protein
VQEMPVISVNKVVDKTRIIGKRRLTDMQSCCDVGTFFSEFFNSLI